MAKFTVVWSDSAEAGLLEIWLETRNRKVQRAADTIDSALAIDPNTKGIRRSTKHRILRAAPLEVLFSVSEPDRLVRVLGVRLFLPE